jgi:hypothetical protein
MDRARSFRAALNARLLVVLGLRAIAPLGMIACGGKVIADPQGNGGNGQGGTTSSGNQGGGVVASSSTGQATVTSCYTPAPDAPCASAAEASPLLPPQTCMLATVVSGPTSQNGQCCYVVYADNYNCGTGRPYLVEGHAVIAPITASARWTAGAAPDVTGLDRATRAELAIAWGKDAALEHASVASFSRFSLDLMAFGAPADLVADAHRAALDEVRHAEICFALVSAYASAPMGPGKLPLPRQVEVSATLADLVAATVREGCIGETMAAVLAAEQLAAATDPAVRAALAIIAEDEARHAELAWRTVAWAIAEGGEPVREAVARELERANEVLPDLTEDAPSAAMIAHGKLGSASVRETMIRALDDVVLPCGRALIAGRPQTSVRSFA